MKKRDWINILILLVVVTVGVYRFRTREFTETSTRIMMGTLVEFSLTSKDSEVQRVLGETITFVSELEGKLSYFNREGFLWQINNSSETEFEIDSDFYELLSLAEEFHRQTEGMYDPTVGNLVKLWGGGRTYPPPADSIAAALALTGFDKLSYTSQKLIRPEGMMIDFGSIAKGFILDRAAEYALSEGVIYGYINAGGDIRIFGEPRRPLNIGVQHPRSSREMITTLVLQEGAIVTSGDYERYFEYQGEKYHHIISPLDGYPVNYVFSVTIIASNATLADVLSTSVFLLPPERGIELVKSYPGTECIIYYHDEEADEIISLRTEGIRDFLVR